MKRLACQVSRLAGPPELYFNWPSKYYLGVVVVIWSLPTFASLNFCTDASLCLHEMDLEPPEIHSDDSNEGDKTTTENTITYTINFLSLITKIAKERPLISFEKNMASLAIRFSSQV
jgi:hypothetical protein